MLLSVLVALVALTSARAHQAFSATADDNDCALYLSGPGRTSAFDYNLNLLRGNFAYDGQHTCITYDAVNQAYLDARKRINVAQPKGDWKAEDIASAGELILDISINLARTYGLTYEEIEKGLPLIDTSKTLIREACPPVFSHVECRPGKYRRFDGLCNNLQHPTWGATMSPFQRLIGPLFSDGINAPRISTTGRDLPLSRVVSRTMHPDDGFHDHAGTVMVIAWGQFMDHDYTLTATPLDPRNRNDPEECCKRPPHLKHPYCNEIRIPDDDYFYRLFHVKCIDFVRAFPSPRPGCRLGSRVPYNTLTGVLDGNTVYGVTEKFARKLRTGFGGLLRMNPVFEEYGLKDLLPLKLDIPDEGCTRPNKSMYCFEAGEIRVNEQLVLTCMHTLMAREHNRVAKGLAKVNPHWDDETLFQEARRINIAEIQHITYNEFLPILLGKDVMEKFGLLLKKEGYWDGYDATVNPDVIDSFASAAFRFGHSLLPTAVERWSKAHKFIASKRLSDLIRRPYDLYRAGVLDEYLMGLMNQVAQAMDDSITQEVTNHLFKKVGARFGMDLVSFNMQRGREFGIPGYMEFRKFCGLPGADTFQELFGSMPNDTIRKYESIFEHPSDVDLWSGGVSERPLPGSMLGPTFACVIATQFSYSRRGDRFWYELPNQPSSFTPEQLVEIKKARLSRIICDNTDIIDTVQVYPMVLPDHELNPRVPCRSGIIPSIDFSKWAEHPPAFEGASRPYFTEVLYSNETAQSNIENATLPNGEEVAVEHCDDTVTTDTSTNGTDGSFNITDRTNSTNQEILKYVVKQNKTESQETNKSGHYKNALKRKRRASSGIFDPHPALATFPLHIIADDDFYPVSDDILTTPQPTLNENLKATAPQVFPLFTPLPVLPPGYLERYNVSTEVRHPVVSKKVESSKLKISKTNAKSLPQPRYREEKSDDENDKPPINNFKSDDFNEYNSELDDFERPYKHTNKNKGENYESPDNDKTIYEHEKNNESNIREKTEKEYEPQTYRHSNHNSQPQGYNFDPKHDKTNKFKPKYLLPYFHEEEQRDEKKHYENKKVPNSKHSSNDNLNNDERYNDEKQRSVTLKLSPSDENEYENENKTPQNSKHSSNENFNAKERYYSDEKQRPVKLESSPSDENEDENENKTPRNSKHSSNENFNNKERYYSDEKQTPVKLESSPSDENEDENENKTPRNSKHSSNENFNNKERYYSDETPRSVTPISSSSDENEYENETPHNAKHPSNNHFNKRERYYSEEKHSSVAPKSGPSDNVHEKNSHYQDENKIQNRINDDGNNEGKNSEEDDFRQKKINVKNDFIEPNFKRKGYTSSDEPQKIYKDDSVEDYNEEPQFHKSADAKYTDGVVHEYTPILNKNTKTYKKFNTQDNSSDNRDYPELYNIDSEHSTETSEEIEKDPFISQREQKKADENVELRSNRFISKNIGDDSSSGNDEEINIHNEDDKSDENEEQHGRPSSHYKDDKSNYQNVNIYSNPSVSAEDNYNEKENKKESESLPEDIHSQESDRVHSEHRSSDSSENEKSYHPSQPQLHKYSDHVEENSDELNSTESTSYDDYTPPRKSIEHHRQSRNEGSEENLNHDHSQENTSQELYKPQAIRNKLSKNNSREESDEKINSEENDTQLSKPYYIHPDDAPVKNNRHDIGSKENVQEHELSMKPKLLYENYQTHDYPGRIPSGFSKGNVDLSDENSKTPYGTYKQLARPEKDHANDQVELFDGNQDGNKKAKISYETFHPSVHEYPKLVPTGFSKEKTDNVNAKISYETYHPHTGSSEDNRDYANVKPTLSYETYHPSPGSAEYHKPSSKESAKENIDNDKLKKSYNTYHPQINTEAYSQKISAETEPESNHASITSTINPKISYETYHPFIISNPEPFQKNVQPEVISNQHIEQGIENVRPTQYFEIYSQVHTPTNVPYNGDSHHPRDKTTHISKEVQGKPPKKYEPKKIFNDYNKFDPYKNLYPDAIKKVPKLPMFYSKKHSELPGLTTKDSSGNVKQQFERIPLDYMHDSQKPRKPKLSNNLSYISSEQSNENLSTKENEKHTKSNKQSDKYQPDLEIKLDDIKLNLPEIKLPESVLLYDSEENEESESNGDIKENYQVKEDSEDDEDDEDSEEAKEEHEEENYESAQLPQEDDDSPKYEDNNRPDDDLYGKFFNDNIDLYESFVQDHFNKKGTFAERTQDIIEDPVLKSTMQDVLRRVSKSTKEAEKSKDPKYGYMWTLNYGRPL